ncbi:hypothetical protein IRJ41_012827 [Triplophysa rosa]|uniref:Uncharacterized protein n=1 Tax=Triplophysa rosa TaxID=992332 RepID=A0A9W8C1T4_TRIRA|nr:hypothetical protein IRJ41_012827 [Triplophysa rosa]
MKLLVLQSDASSSVVVLKSSSNFLASASFPCFADSAPDPLNSGDDVSEQDIPEIFDTENIIVCQYDKPPEPDTDVLLLVLRPTETLPTSKSHCECDQSDAAQQAMLSKSSKTSQDRLHVLSYTPDTNKLHSLRNNTADAVRKMAEITSQKFRESRIVISTLLPRRDTSPHTIYSINAEISRACSAFPKVHLAPHQHIGLKHLYDGLHLQKDGEL